MNREILKMYRNDRINVVAWIVFMWIILGYVFIQGIMNLVSSYVAEIVGLAVAVATGVFVTSALVSLLRHLRKHGAVLYEEDLRNLRRLQNRGLMDGDDRQ